jgi:hypothetical protein
MEDTVFVLYNGRDIDVATTKIEIVVDWFNPSFLNNEVQVFRNGMRIEKIENDMRLTKDILREKLSKYTK